MTHPDYMYRMIRQAETDIALETLFESVRTLAELVRQSALLAGHEGTARRIQELIDDELTWPEDKEVTDAFGEAG